MNTKSLIPSGRKFTAFFIILSVVAVFFVGYNFYFIPGNQGIVHKNAFLIMENISRNIKERNNYLETSFSTILKTDAAAKDRTAEQLQRQLDNYKTGGKIIFSKALLKFIDTTARTAGDSSVFLASVRHDSLFYLPNDFRNSPFGIYIPSANFSTPLLAAEKDELFDAYLMRGNTAGLIYSDPGISVNTAITDSLIAKNGKALFAGIKDVDIRGVEYKMFYYPFMLEHEQVQLCGFLKTGLYVKKLHYVPVTFIYPVIIVLLFVLILLPMVKFYIMGKNEYVNYADFVLAAVAFFAGTAIVTVIIIQVLLLMAADVRIDENLKSLSGQIEKNFTTELRRSYFQLDRIDSVVQNDKRYASFEDLHKNNDSNVSSLVGTYLKSSAPGSDVYYDFNRVAWIDAAGEQRIKGHIDKELPVYTNVAARNYFQCLKNDNGYPLPGSSTERFCMEPLNSWTNGGFSVIVSKKSRLGNESIVTLSAQMNSVVQTILPPGYGFCIIDESGKVLLHSETARNLQENFIEKVNPSRPLSEAIKSRQADFFSSMNLYGKTTAVAIKPIGALPFHLIAFYDKGYIIPVNMRILSFSFLFFILNFFTCVLLWFAFFRRKYQDNELLFHPMLYLKWIVPKESNLRFYLLSEYFIGAYLLFQLGLLFSSNVLDINNYSMLIMVLLLPVNILSGIYVINYRVRESMYDGDKKQLKHAEDLKKVKRNVIYAILTQLVVTILVWTLSDVEGFSPEAKFVFFTLLFNGVLWVIFLLPQTAFSFCYKTRWNYMHHYAAYATLVILSLTCIPVSIFTWYAHNQEITQSVKKSQLSLADALQKKATANYRYFKELDSVGAPVAYRDSLQHQAGIYKIYNDSIALGNSNDSCNSTYEKLYFSVAKEISNNYYDPLLVPALKDTAADSTWCWGKNSRQSLVFSYHLYSDPVDTGDMAVHGQGVKKKLIITSQPPARYKIINSWKGILLLAIVVFVFLGGLYKLIQNISRRLFLRKFITAEDADHEVRKNKVLNLFREYKKSSEAKGILVKLDEKEIETLLGEYIRYETKPVNKHIYGLEKKMYDAIDKYRDFYSYVWSKRSDKEKYLLFNFAQNAFANFKNTKVIYSLLRSGVLLVVGEEIQIFSASFRAFVLEQKSSDEMLRLKNDLRQDAAWQTFRMPLLLTVLGVALFIFITQEQTFQKATALLTGLTTIVTLTLKFFTDGTSLFSSKK